MESVRIREEAGRDYPAQSPGPGPGADPLNCFPERNIRAERFLERGSVVNLHGPGPEPIERTLVQLRAAHVKPVRAGPERVCGRENHGIGMSGSYGLFEPVRDRDMPVCQGRIQDEKRVRVRGIDFVDEEDSAILVDPEELAPRVDEAARIARREKSPE